MVCFGLNWIRNKEDKLKSNYHIKYAMSKDGINWIRKGDIAIDFKNKNEINIARPCVLKNNNNYESWFSYGFWWRIQKKSDMPFLWMV